MPVRVPRTDVLFRDHRHQNIAKFNLAMDTLDLSYITHIADVNAAVDEFIGGIYALYDAHCPMKSVKLSENDPPYITPLVKTLLLKRNRLLRNGRHAQAREIQERINSAVQGILQHRRLGRISLGDATVDQ